MTTHADRARSAPDLVVLADDQVSARRLCAEHGIRVLGVHDTGQRSLSGLRIYWIAAEAGFPPGILVQGGMRPELVGSPDDIEDRLRERIASGPAPLGLKRPEDN